MASPERTLLGDLTDLEEAVSGLYFVHATLDMDRCCSRTKYNVLSFNAVLSFRYIQIIGKTCFVTEYAIKYFYLS